MEFLKGLPNGGRSRHLDLTSWLCATSAPPPPDRKRRIFSQGRNFPRVRTRTSLKRNTLSCSTTYEYVQNACTLCTQLLFLISLGDSTARARREIEEGFFRLHRINALEGTRPVLSLAYSTNVRYVPTASDIASYVLYVRNLYYRRSARGQKKESTAHKFTRATAAAGKAIYTLLRARSARQTYFSLRSLSSSFPLFSLTRSISRSFDRGLRARPDAGR